MAFETKKRKTMVFQTKKRKTMTASISTCTPIVDESPWFTARDEQELRQAMQKHKIIIQAFHLDSFPESIQSLLLDLDQKTRRDFLYDCWRYPRHHGHAMLQHVYPRVMTRVDAKIHANMDQPQHLVDEFQLSSSLIGLNDEERLEALDIYLNKPGQKDLVMELLDQELELDQEEPLNEVADFWFKLITPVTIAKWMCHDALNRIQDHLVQRLSYMKLQLALANHLWQGLQKYILQQECNRFSLNLIPEDANLQLDTQEQRIAFDKWLRQLPLLNLLRWDIPEIRSVMTETLGTHGFVESIQKPNLWSSLVAPWTKRPPRLHSGPVSPLSVQVVLMDPEIKFNPILDWQPRAFTLQNGDRQILMELHTQQKNTRVSFRFIRLTLAVSARDYTCSPCFETLPCERVQWDFRTHHLSGHEQVHYFESESYASRGALWSAFVQEQVMQLHESSVKPAIPLLDKHLPKVLCHLVGEYLLEYEPVQVMHRGSHLCISTRQEARVLCLYHGHEACVARVTDGPIQDMVVYDGVVLVLIRNALWRVQAHKKTETTMNLEPFWSLNSLGAKEDRLEVGSKIEAMVCVEATRQIALLISFPGLNSYEDEQVHYIRKMVLLRPSFSSVHVQDTLDARCASSSPLLPSRSLLLEQLLDINEQRIQELSASHPLSHPLAHEPLDSD